MKKIIFKYEDGSLIAVTTDKSIEEIVKMLGNKLFVNYDLILKKYSIINIDKVKIIEVE